MIYRKRSIWRTNLGYTFNRSFILDEDNTEIEIFIPNKDQDEEIMIYIGENLSEGIIEHKNFNLKVLETIREKWDEFVEQIQLDLKDERPKRIYKEVSDSLYRARKIIYSDNLLIDNSSAYPNTIIKEI